MVDLENERIGIEFKKSPYRKRANPLIRGKKEQLKFVEENRIDIENDVCKNNIIKIKIKH